MQSSVSRGNPATILYAVVENLLALRLDYARLVQVTYEFSVMYHSCTICVPNMYNISTDVRMH